MPTNQLLFHDPYEVAFMELNIKEFLIVYMSYLSNILQIQNLLILHILFNRLVYFMVLNPCI